MSEPSAGGGASPAGGRNPAPGPTGPGSPSAAGGSGSARGLSPPRGPSGAGGARPAGTVGAPPDDPALRARRAELAERLRHVRQRIDAACAAAGRPADQITLIAITKTRPASDIRLLYELGQRDFGENRDQEAAPKAAQCADLPITWHFVGQLQTNKAASVARYADVIHSVDRIRLVRALGAAARRQHRVLTCLIQVNLAEQDADAGRGGAPPSEVGTLAEAVAGESGLLLGGVMAVAPMGIPAAEAFARLAPCAAAVRAVRPQATIISAGMSGDLEAAVAAGATHLRIGTALLGDRRPPVM